MQDTELAPKVTTVTESQPDPNLDAQRREAAGQQLGHNALVQLPDGSIVDQATIVQERSAGHDMANGPFKPNH